MSVEPSSPRVDLARERDFRLGQVQVRPATRELLGPAGRREVLEPRIMQVLVALARRRGEVVSRDELLGACWYGCVVGDDAVNRCVAALRRLAQVHGGMAIETIARIGYRLDEAGGRRRDPVLVAVLPFETLSDEAGLAHLSDGVSEEILQAIAGRTGLKVLGRAASFRFRGERKVVADVAAQLRATHVLDGSVRSCGARVRVCVHLIECEGQTTVWSERFDSELPDVFALQDAVADGVATALRRTLAPAWRRALES